MGTQQEQDQEIEEKAFGFEEENLDPEEEARLRGELIDEEEEDPEEPISAEVLEKIAGEGSPVVPHARFHEVNERNKELERLLAERDAEDARKAEKASADLQEMELKHYQLLLEGSEDEAVALRLEINKRIMEDAKRAARDEIKAEKEAEQAKEAANALNTVITSLEKQYPMLDINSESADEFAISAVNTQMQQFLAAGKSPAEALSDAVALVVDRLGLSGAEIKPAKSNKQQAVVRNAKAAEMQPPRMNGGMGDRALRHGIKPVSQMSDKEFDNMDPEYERKLRGEA